MDEIFAEEINEEEGNNEVALQGVKHDEVDRYVRFTSLPDHTADPLIWWKAAESKFPTIAKMARDYLAIQATSVAISESIFSQSGQLITPRRASLAEESIESSLLCRSWLRSDALKEFQQY